MGTNMKRSIRNKLMTMASVVVTIAIVILCVAAFAGFSKMQQSSYLMSSELVAVSSETTEDIILEQAMNDLQHLAQGTAATVDSSVGAFMNQLDVLSAMVEGVYKEPDNYALIPIEPPSKSNKGVNVTQVVYAKEVDVETVKDEVGLLGNVSIAMNQMVETFTGTGGVNIGTESGITIMSDCDSDIKLDKEYFDARTRTWYMNGINNQDIVWTPVYEDAYGRGLSIMCTKSVTDSKGDAKAVVAISAQLKELGNIITDLNIGENGAAFVVDNYGDVIIRTHLREEDEGVVEKQENLFNSENPEIVKVVEKMVLGESGIFTSNFEGTEMIWAYEPIKNIPWTVVTLYQTNEIMEPLMRAKGQTNYLAIEAQKEVTSITQAAFIAMIIGVMISALLALFVGVLYSRKIAAPIRKLEGGVRQISKGDLDYKLDLKTGDEIQSLSDAFNDMTTDLQLYISELTEVMVEKQKGEAELKVAADIQLGMLPTAVPEYERANPFDISASMIPAKEVGGDFYDYFKIDEKRLGIVIADVSGKGVASALFMVKAKTLIQNYAQKGLEPGEVFESVNNILCENNESSMFVTAWFGVLDIDTGKVIYVNAGHNHPVISCEKEGFNFIKCDSNFVLAGLEGMQYSEGSFILTSGDILYLYTDGVTEALNIKKELYGDERLITAIKGANKKSINDVLLYIKKDVDEFANGEVQADDITMLGIMYGK